MNKATETQSISDEWEVVTEKLNEHDIPVDRTERLIVPGGWLYRTWKSGASFSGDPDLSDIMAMVFVPDASR